MSKILLAGFMVGVSLLSGCASKQAANEQAEQQQIPDGDPKDPLEPLKCLTNIFYGL